ncbi:hypothetical protein TWF506_008775 [Arthrobotrys conoides]|uniref:JmjC domain-containing protein n=1 Tax=Arthrobotrys conoides TaxID=74498 RepID=A0AAN8NQC9_9PEZI
MRPRKPLRLTRQFSTSKSQPRNPFPIHPSPSTFSKTFKNPTPHHIPTKFPSTFLPPHTPAFKNWFLQTPPYNRLNIPYFHSLTSKYSLEFHVPVEITPTTPGSDAEITSFSWNAFLEYLSVDINELNRYNDGGGDYGGTTIPKLYLTQHEPPHFLQNDLPPPFPHLGFSINPPSHRRSNRSSKPHPTKNPDHPPEIDIYTTSIWLSRSSPLPEYQTHTPLHRDPSHNIFLQLSSSKRIITIPPQLGSKIFGYLHRNQRLSSTDPRGRIRDGLLTFKESSVLDRVIWGCEDEEEEGGMDEVEMEVVKLLEKCKDQVFETVVERGEAVFIPEGWWHSVKSVATSEEDGGGGGGVVGRKERGGVE